MDTVTHVVLGAAVGGRLRPRTTTALKPVDYIFVTAVAAVFPDIDYLLFFVDPARFLADWHQGATHSLVLMPGWAALLTLAFCAAPRYRRDRRRVFLLSVAALFSHIFLDLLTVYGTQLFYPLSDTRYSAPLLYVVDAVVTSLLAITLIGCLYAQRAFYFGAVGLSIYLSVLLGCKGFLHSRMGEDVVVLPQPLAPLFWQLIRKTDSGYETAYVRLSGDRAPDPAVNSDIVSRFLSSYRPYERAVWERYGVSDGAIPREIWVQREFEVFKRFAQFPVVHAVERGKNSECGWFTDLRYVLPEITPFFRYGMCREHAGGAWHLYRLRQFSRYQRQRID